MFILSCWTSSGASCCSGSDSGSNMYGCTAVCCPAAISPVLLQPHAGCVVCQRFTSEWRQFHSRPAWSWLSSTELRKEHISPWSDPVHLVHWKDQFVRTTRPPVSDPAVCVSLAWRQVRCSCADPTTTHSVRLHAQLSQITVIRAAQPDNCNYPSIHAGEKTGLLGRSMSQPGTLGGAVPISTSGNRNTSGWPLYVTSCLGIQERWRTKSEERLRLCTLRIWCTW